MPLRSLYFSLLTCSASEIPKMITGKENYKIRDLLNAAYTINTVTKI